MTGGREIMGWAAFINLFFRLVSRLQQTMLMLLRQEEVVLMNLTVLRREVVQKMLIDFEMCSCLLCCSLFL